MPNTFKIITHTSQNGSIYYTFNIYADEKLYKKIDIKYKNSMQAEKGAMAYIENIYYIN